MPGEYIIFVLIALTLISFVGMLFYSSTRVSKELLEASTQHTRLLARQNELIRQLIKSHIVAHGIKAEVKEDRTCTICGEEVLEHHEKCSICDTPLRLYSGSIFRN